MIAYRNILGSAALLLAMGVACDSTIAADSAPPYVVAAVHDQGRTPWGVQRDALRKPSDVLAFAQIKPGMVVVDLVPDDGYYTRMLAKLVGPKGKVYAIVPGGGGGGARTSRMQQREGKLPAAVPKDEAQACVQGCYPTGRPPYLLPVDNILALQNIDEYANITVLWEDLTQRGGEIAIPEQADVIFTADGYSALHANAKIAMPSQKVNRPAYQPKPLDMAAVSKSIFATLKPGGFYVVADYAARKGSGFKDADSLHRTEAEATKAEILPAGFALDGESKALANASDDDTKPVAGMYAQRDKADQYLLRFKKPASGPNTDKRPKGTDPVANYYGNTFVVGVDLKGITGQGERIRTVFYNEDHTYQEFGHVGEGPGPMQSGTWFWDAAGNNCQIHQYPIDERSNVVCHIDVIARPVGVVQDQNPGGGGAKVEIVKGYVLKDLIIPDDGVKPASGPAYVMAAVADRGRTQWDVQRDPLRKPTDVLTFAQIKPGMTVVNLAPGDGYYTRILASLVGPKGKVFAVVPNGSGESTRAERMEQRDGKPPSFVPVDEAEACALGCYPTGKPPYMLDIDEALAIQNISEYKNVTALWEELGSYGGDLAVPAQADVVFTADAYHDLHAQKGPVLPEAVPGRPNIFKPLDMPVVTKSIFAALKPGGVYLVIDHAAAKGAGFSAVDSLHRTEVDAVKAEITAAGFAFDGESKALSFGSDDHSKPVGGVFAQRDNTDQYVLRFKKPANAANTDHRPSAQEEAAIMKNYYIGTEVFRVEMVKKPGIVNGGRLRFNYYSPDHSYQEFGRVGEGPGPMQAGTWFWDAAGHNCQLHQFPIDERQSIVCHDDVLPHTMGVVEDRYLGKRPEKVQVEIVPGRQYFY